MSLDHFKHSQCRFPTQEQRIARKQCSVNWNKKVHLTFIVGWYCWYWWLSSIKISEKRDHKYFHTAHQWAACFQDLFCSVLLLQLHQLWFGFEIRGYWGNHTNECYQMPFVLALSVLHSVLVHFMRDWHSPCFPVSQLLTFLDVSGIEKPDLPSMQPYSNQLN